MFDLRIDRLIGGTFLHLGLVIEAVHPMLQIPLLVLSSVDVLPSLALCRLDGARKLDSGNMLDVFECKREDPVYHHSMAWFFRHLRQLPRNLRIVLKPVIVVAVGGVVIQPRIMRLVRVWGSKKEVEVHDARASLQERTTRVGCDDVQARIEFKAQEPKVLRKIEADMESRESVIGWNDQCWCRRRSSLEQMSERSELDEEYWHALSSSFQSVFVNLLADVEKYVVR